MNDKQIQAFLTISETGSMNRAADKLYISQPALKKRMDMLEAELGVALLARDSGGCTLTEAGQVFLKGIRPLHVQMEKVIEKTKRACKQQILRICTMPDIAMREQDEKMIAFMHENPDVLIEQVPLPTSRWFESIEEGGADICYSYNNQSMMEIYKQKGLRFHPVNKRQKMACVFSSRHPLAKNKRIAVEDLKGMVVYAGPLLYKYSGLREYAQSNGFEVLCDESAGKRYEMIGRCENGAVYIHAKSYSEDLKPLAVVQFTGFSLYPGFIYGADSSGLIARYIRFYEALL